MQCDRCQATVDAADCRDRTNGSRLAGSTGLDILTAAFPIDETSVDVRPSP